MKCEWCYEVADWRVQTVNGGRDVCQRHYDEVVRGRDALTRDLPDALVALVHATR